MNTESNEPLVDWAQFAEIAGDLGDPSDAEQLAEIWHLLRGDIDQKWASLDHQTDAAEVRSSLHQIRGFVATWGLARVAQVLQMIEFGPDPLGQWLRERAALAELFTSSVVMVEARYPFLAPAEKRSPSSEQQGDSSA